MKRTKTSGVSDLDVSELVAEIKSRIEQTGLHASCKKHLSDLLNDSLDHGMPLGCSSKNNPEAYECIMDYDPDKLAKELDIKITHRENRKILELHFEALKPATVA